VNGLVVREATPADAPALVELGQAVSSEPEGWLATVGDWRNVADERRYLRAIRRSPHAAVFLAENRAGIVGRLSLARDSHPASQHVADLGLMVARDQRRRGVGRSLLARAVEWARENDVEKLELHVFPHNQPAIKLYEQFGFEHEGLRRGHYRRGAELLDVVLMAYLIR
jgi:RimJ/RimL family protein N-acetyltransferase